MLPSQCVVIRFDKMLTTILYRVPEVLCNARLLLTIHLGHSFLLLLLLVGVARNALV